MGVGRRGDVHAPGAGRCAPGTSITLHLKPADPEDRLFDYTDPRKVREIVTRYSDFITWPIRMVPLAAPEEEDVPEFETVNSRKALWTRPASEVTDEEYAEFYRRISHDWNDPLETIRLNIEGTLQYQALLFLPERATANLFSPDAKHGVQLYVNRVFVMDDAEELLPGYLRFVKGVVDSQDLALNVSREILQQDRQIEAMRKRLTKRVIQAVKGLATNEPEKYGKFWGEFGRVLKEGLLQDFANRDAILEVCSFETTAQEEPTSLKGYVERMQEGQEKIFFLTGDSRPALESSPYMEAFKPRAWRYCCSPTRSTRSGSTGCRSSTASSSSPSPRARSTSTSPARASGRSRRSSSPTCSPGWARC